MKRPQGNIWFLLIIAVVFFVLAGTMAALWYFNIVGMTASVYFFLLLATFFLTLLFLALVLGFIGVIYLLKKGTIPAILIKPIRITVSYFLPMALKIGQLMGVSEDTLKKNYIYLVNRLFTGCYNDFAPEQVLVLAPHCLQDVSCPNRVTHNIENCRKCGKCQIQDLIELKERFNFDLAVVTGGTWARQVVKNKKPKAIIAIACERDLMSGIQDVFPKPVLGIINIRPQGPCLNTEVLLEEFTEAVNSICQLPENQKPVQ